MIKIEIGKNDKGQRLDRFLKKYFDAAPLSMIYRLIRKDVKVNGKRGKEATLLEEGDVLTVYITEEQAAQLHRGRTERSMGTAVEINAKRRRGSSKWHMRMMKSLS